MPFLGTSVHPDCAGALQETALLLEDLGHEVAEAAPDIDGPAFSRAFLTMVCGEAGAEIAARIGESVFEDLKAPVVRACGKDTPIPFSPVLERFSVPQVEDVVAGVRTVLGKTRKGA